MPTVNQEVRHVVSVVNIGGVAVTGLVEGNFTVALQRRSGETLVSASEDVVVSEIGAGLYWFKYTPTIATIYRLTLSHATHIATPGVIEDSVNSGVASPTGPYLSNRANVRTALHIVASDGTYTTAHADDARIDALLAEVTSWAETFCGRTFSVAILTEYPRIHGNPIGAVFLTSPPVASVSSLWQSFDTPRVYDATTLLVEGTDYFVDTKSGVVEFAVQRACFGPPSQIVKVVYTGGYDTMPADLERAAQEVIAVKLYRGKDKLYHVTGQNAGDGAIAFVSRDDIPDDAMRVFERYRMVT